MPEGIRVECVEYVAGIRNIASIGMMQLVQEAKFEPRPFAHNRWGERQARGASSFFWIPSTARPANRGNTDSLPPRFHGDGRFDRTGSILRVSLRAWKLPPTNVFLTILPIFAKLDTTRGSSYCFSWLGYFCCNEVRGESALFLL